MEGTKLKIDDTVTLHNIVVEGKLQMSPELELL